MSFYLGILLIKIISQVTHKQNTRMRENNNAQQRELLIKQKNFRNYPIMEGKFVSNIQERQHVYTFKKIIFEFIFRIFQKQMRNQNLIKNFKQSIMNTIIYKKKGF
ncbi:unnamed protein product [Paramecium sonneborni]|uniref:Transmembrane protein n=1 Tax=Paramecium sonneborni TaxID=65129 RepID=A0A8S1M8J6_9CILI|nr:unnamed protein product [Paramecium sonneborni]